MLVRLKTAEEIEGFAAAGRLAAQIMDRIVEAAKPGVATVELDHRARDACADLGVAPAFLGYRGFPAAICTSINEELVHGIPGGRILLEGDLLKIDIGVDLDGFLGDMASTVTVGKQVPDKLAFDCQTALMRGIAAARPGRDIGDIGDAISRTAKEGGWKVVTNYGGHGLDRNRLHADPFVDNAGRKAHGLRLRPGMVLAIEPMFVDGPDAETKEAGDGWTVLVNGRSAHCEHTIVVAELGEPRILTRKENG